MEEFIKESKTLFKDYRELYSLDICSCCVDKYYEDSLTKSNRFEIPAKTIYQYNDSAKSGYTEDTASELKYFTPRILELVCNEKEIHHSTELFFTRYSYVPEDAWSKEELDFFQRFALNYWQQVIHLNKLPFNEDLISLLIMLSKLPISLTRLLNIWINQKSLSSILQFANLYLHEISYKRFKINNAFAEKEFNETVIEFLTDNNTIDTLIKTIEELVWIENIKLTTEEDNLLDALYVVLKNL